MNKLVSIILALVMSLGITIMPATGEAQADSGLWEWQGPLSEGNHIYGVWGSSANDVFAVGQSGVILHFNGTDWITMDSGTSTDLWDVWGTSASDVYAVGLNATILHYDGDYWTAVDSGLYQIPDFNLFCIWGFSSTDIYVGAPSGKIIHYDGSDWTTVVWSVPGIILDIWGTSATDVYATSSFGVIMHYNGTDWNEVDTPLTPGSNQDLWGVWGSSSDDVFAVGRNSVVLHYDGDDWIQMDTSVIPSYIILQGVWGSGSSDVFAVGTYGTIIHYNGASWTAMHSTLGNYIYGVWGSSGSDVYAVGYYGAIIRYNGTSWLPTSGGTAPEFLLGSWGTSSTNVYAVGTGNSVIKYDGTRWSAVDTGTTNSQLNAVWGSSANDVFVVGLDGLILHWDGSDWTQMTSGTIDHLFAVWGTAPNDVHAIGYEKTMLHYNGSTWSNVGPGFGMGVLHGLWGSAADDVWAAGAAGRIYHYTGLQPPGTPSWEYVYTGLGGNYNSIWGSAEDDIFAVGDSGVIAHYDGSDWSSMSSGTTDHLRTVWGSSATDVYAAGESGVYAGNIYHYDGSDWTQIDTGLGALGSNHYRGIWGTSASDIFVVGSTGAILHYQSMLTVDFSANVTSGAAPLSVDFTSSVSGGTTPFTYAWDFDNDTITDDTTANPVYVYNNAGVYTVTLQVTDDTAATDTETKVDYITVTGVTTEEPSITITTADVSDDPGSDPLYTTGAPGDIDWTTALGFNIVANGPNGTYPFRITFPTPITPGFTLYKLPGWSEVTYTIFDAYTVEVNLTITDGELDPPFVLGADILPPTMETIVEAEGEYFNSAPAFTNFGFDDGLALDDGWYQIDSYSGVWTSLFTDVAGTSWDNDGWTLPGFDSLADGSHTIYFRASDDTGNEEGESGEWSWQFNKTTPTAIEPMIDFDPDTLNLTSNGKWVTVFIEMPEGYDVHDIDGSTVLLNDEVSAYLGKEGWAKADANDGNIMDHDGDGISERMVKFEMESVKQILAVGDEVEITISGLVDGIGFEGTISIRVINKGGEGKAKGK